MSSKKVEGTYEFGFGMLISISLNTLFQMLFSGAHNVEWCRTSNSQEIFGEVLLSKLLQVSVNGSTSIGNYMAI